MTRLNVVLVLALVAALALAVVADSRRPWKAHGSEVVQITTPSGAVDRCPTCHQATLPGARAVGPHSRGGPPPGAHPPVKGHEDVARLGCTPCHGGQGRRLDHEAHTPALGGGPDPFLRGIQRQARCARCHVPTDLAGAPALSRGFDEYLQAGCTGCHNPGRSDEGLGPDLRRLGRRSDAELRDALLRPRQTHGGATMWSLRWRYDKGASSGPTALDALIVALLAMNEDPAPYRRSWARPTLRVDPACAGCHQEVTGGLTGGAPHRCTLLKRKEGLRCRSCHGEEATRIKPAVTHAECPAVRAATPLCPVCHNRAADGAPR